MSPEPQSPVAEGRQPARVTLEYASPRDPDRPRRPVYFGFEMIKASALACVLTSIGSWAYDVTPTLLLGVAIWAGVAVTWAWRFLYPRAPEDPPKPRHWSDALWRPTVLSLAFVTASMVVRYGDCPHQRYWAVGPYVRVTVTDPRGPCHNGLKLRPALFRWLWD